MNTSNMYWEIYDDQDAADFSLVGYMSLSGEQVVIPIEENLPRQVSEIRRANGSDTDIRLYRQSCLV